MKFSSADPLAEYEMIAADFLAGRAEAAGDLCESVFERSDAELADRLITAAAGRLGKLEFGRLVGAFGRLRNG